MRDHERYGADEWSVVEKHRLNSLPRERVPSDLSKTRTVAELRQRGLVRRHRPVIARGLWIAVAAGVAFVAGGFVGYRLALTRFETQAHLATVAARSSSDLSTNAGHVVWF